MKKFKALIEGKNCYIKMDDGAQYCGFFTTRFVEADDALAAENMVIKLVKDELRGIVLNKKNNPPVMYVDELFEVESFGEKSTSGAGFTWFKEG